MRKTLLLASSLLALAMNIWAASIETSPTELQKGELLEIRGTLTEAKNGTVTATLNEKTVFEKSFETDQYNAFYMVYKTGFLDPAGEWTLGITGFDANAKVKVLPTIESSVFAVRFLSPSETAFMRNETIEIAVEVLRDEKPAENLEIFTWGLKGEKIRLASKSPGNYVLSYGVPFDAKTGEWEILAVMSETRDGKEIFGGEKKRYVSIEKAQIVFEVMQPEIPRLKIGEKTLVELKPGYSNSSLPPRNVLMSATMAGEPLDFSRGEDGTYIAEFLPLQKHAGEITLEVKAIDAAGNEGAMKNQYIVTGEIEYIVKQNQAGILAAALALLCLLAIGTIGFSKLLEKSRLEARKRSTENRLKSIQKEYFEYQSMDRRTFEEDSAKYESELAQAEKGLSKFKQKK